MNKAPAPKFTILTTSHTGYEQVWIQNQKPGIRYLLPGCILEDTTKAKLTICFQVEHRLDTQKGCIPDLANKTEKEPKG